jgi:hypothetical protein
MSGKVNQERFSKVSRRVWNDAKFRSLTPAPPNAQTLWLRLLTGPELTNIPGCFQAWEAGLAQALGWPMKGFREAFAEAFREGLAKADWEVGFVWVPKAIAHNKPESPNVVRSWRATWNQLPECALKDEAYHGLKAFLEGLPKGFAIAFGEACGKASPKASPNQEQEQEQEQEIERAQAEPAPPAVREWKKVPAEWSPNDRSIQEATALGVDVEFELRKFRAHKFKTAHTDADLSWEAWYRSDYTTKKPSAGGSNGDAQGKIVYVR